MRRLAASRKRHGLAFKALAFLSLLVLGGCTTQSYNTINTLEHGGDTHRVLLMPVDVQLSVLTAGGLLEPHAEWTQQAHAHIRQSCNAQLAKFQTRVVDSEQYDDYADLDLKQVQLTKLNNAVGQSILLHQFDEAMKLPTKVDSFDWTIGPEAVLLKDKYGADYALFIYMRDSYASAGRAAVMVASAILSLGRYVPPGGQQVGFASLVDLRTGQVVWFNRLARGTGDLRTAEAAAESVETLLSDFPE